MEGEGRQVRLRARDLGTRRRTPQQKEQEGQCETPRSGRSDHPDHLSIDQDYDFQPVGCSPKGPRRHYVYPHLDILAKPTVFPLSHRQACGQGPLTIAHSDDQIKA